MALLAALTAAAPAQEIVDFRTPDGTRCVLVVDRALLHVQWAVATWADPADDPPGLAGLAFATVVSSLHGTWRTGSLDQVREQDALAALDRANAEPASATSPAAAAAALRDARREAEALADVRMFPRVLAAAPAWRPEVRDHGAVAIFALATVPEAIAEVARLLVERREQQPLRRLPEAWREHAARLVAARRADASAAVRAEVLELTMPGHPLTVWLGAPAPGWPRREQALGTWAATQRPERTVHVLLGNFDAAAVRDVLAAAFATTALPPAPPPTRPPVRPLANARRSAITGAGSPAAALAWALPADVDRGQLAAAVRWLAGGPDSVLGQELQRAGRAAAAIRGTAPWPPSPDGRGLLLIECSDSTGGVGLADLLLSACRQAVGKPPDERFLRAVTTAMQHEARATAPDDRDKACALAARTLQWPTSPITTDAPDNVDGRAVQALLQRVFAGHPAVVEATP
jgi:hypothetical protein